MDTHDQGHNDSEIAEQITSRNKIFAYTRNLQTLPQNAPIRLNNNLHSSSSGCVVECRICNPEVAGSNLGRGYFAPRSTHPSIPPGSVNEYQLRLGRQRQVWFIQIADERVGVQVKL